MIAADTCAEITCTRKGANACTRAPTGTHLRARTHTTTHARTHAHTQFPTPTHPRHQRPHAHTHTLADGAVQEIKAAAASKHANAKVAGVSCDLSNAQDSFKAFAESETLLGGAVDLLVCNAGSSKPGYFEQMQPEVFEEMMKINYFSSVYIAQVRVRLSLALCVCIEDQTSPSLVFSRSLALSTNLLVS